MIYISRKITVNKDTATIDIPIFIYRGDKEIEIEFEIVNSKVMFIELGESNVIRTSKAFYGQLVIINPNGTNAFTEMTETNDGLVKFRITGEMIDQVDEVGEYSFQIRLFDKGKGSRLTLPPILEGLKICEPIAAESEENIVGEGAVGYSRVTYGEKLEVFDEEGNYNETVWENGDIITEGKLNKIEEALDVINDKVEGIDLSNYVIKDYVDQEIAKIELLPGPQGIQGEKGDKGDKGDTGQQGEKGEQGIQGIQGEKGDKGDTGEKGADGLTTSIKVDGKTYTQTNGLITLPNYPKETDLTGYAKKSEMPTKTSQLTNDSGYITDSDLTDYATKEYVSDEIGGALQYTLQAEEWTFELADGTTVTKKVVIK